MGDNSMVVSGTCSVNSSYSTSINVDATIGERTRLLKDCLHHSAGQDSLTFQSTNQPPSDQTITKRQIILLVLIVYGNFWVATCYSLLAPFFPAEAEKKGVSPTIYGFIFGAFQLVMFITSPIYGKIIPITTSRFLLISGLFVSSACSVLFGALYYSPGGLRFIILAFAVRIVEALGSAAYYVAALTIASSEFTRNRATVLSSLESVSGIGMIVGPTVGGALYQVGGYVLPFFTLGGIIFVGVIIAAFVIPTTEEVSSGNLFSLMKKTDLYIYWLVFIYCFCVIGYNEATLAYHLKVFNFKPVVLGSVFIIPAGLYALGTPVWGFLCDKCVKPEILCFTGSIVITVAFLFLGPIPFLGLTMKLWMVIMALVLLGIGVGGMMISSFILALTNAVKEGFPDDVSTYALVSGIFSSMAALGAFIGPSIGGVLLGYIGYERSTIVFFGISLFIAVVLFIHLICSCSRQRAQSEEQQSAIHV